MLTNTMQKYEDSADLYTSTLGGTTENPILNLEFSATIRCQSFNDGTGRLFIHTPDNTIRINDVVANVRDRNGILVHVYGMQFRVMSMQAVRDPFGNVLRYRYTASKVN